MNVIRTASNEKIKYIRKLLKSGKYRREEGLFVVEGIRMFREIPEELLCGIFYTKEAEEKYLKENAAFRKYQEAGLAYPVTEQVFSGLSDTEHPQGILALVKTLEWDIASVLTCKGAPFLLILEHLQDPGNMGTIIRTAEGAGVTGIVISSDSADIYNPKVVRSTMGSLFRVPIINSRNLREDISFLKEKGIRIFGAHLSGSSVYEKNLTVPAAFLIGNEGNGLSAEISEMADELLRIPMMGKVESLNAAVSAAVISYEVLRQRKY